MRRRYLIAINKKTGTLASKWYTINPSPSDTAERNTKPYYFSVKISGTLYYYEADYPFYLVDNSTDYCIAFPQGYTLRNGTSYAPSKINLSVKNGIIYAREIYTRTAIIASNKDIYIWG